MGCSIDVSLGCGVQDRVLPATGKTCPVGSSFRAILWMEWTLFLGSRKVALNFENWEFLKGEVSRVSIKDKFRIWK